VVVVAIGNAMIRRKVSGMKECKVRLILLTG
jgi:hypothetical protein